MLFIQFRLQYPTEPNNCDIASLQKSSQNVPQIGPKILPKMLPNRSKMDPKIDPKWSLGASGANMAPKSDFSSILGTSFGAGNAPQIDPKIKTFSGVPQELVLCDGSSQNAPKLPPKWSPKSTFFSGGAKLENLALASTGA